MKKEEKIEMFFEVIILAYSMTCFWVGKMSEVLLGIIIALIVLAAWDNRGLKIKGGLLDVEVNQEDKNTDK